MKLLLDTHTFIWWDSEPQRLSQQVLNMCQDPENVLLASVASFWEMQIKLQLGKLKLNKPLEELVSGQQEINKIDILDVKLEHILALANLPSLHRDPFDRLLIAQTDVEGAILVSKDQIFTEYEVKVVW
ncbi:MAG: type II toxin-antitoxin system VapC family toxin [Desulfobacterales bacterium]|jgi:PIN domain nuclease of toxin-antitoxin system